jgi:NTP pyrophosphatase (non-canonical NTP hydrolase)
MNDKQREILVITQEECAEVIQEVSKIFRFGIDELHKDGITHQTKLEMEVGDLMCMIDLLITYGLIDQQKIEIAKENKQQKLRKWSKIYD